MRTKHSTFFISGALFFSSPLTAFRLPIGRLVPPSAPYTRRDSVLPREDEQISISYNNVNIKKIKSSGVVTKTKSSTVNGKVSKRRVSRKKTTNTAMSDPVFVRKRTATLLNATSSDNQYSAPGKLRIDKKTFDSLISAWAYNPQTDSSHMALTLLSRMEHLCSCGNDKLVPDTKTYNKVIHVISLSGINDAGSQAEELLNKMIDNNLQPDTWTYTYVIDAYARSSLAESPHHAQRLVEQMELCRQAGQNVHPTARAWNSVIQSWANHGDVVRANACLDTMEKLADSTKNEEVRPNSFNCNSVISAWAKSGDDNNAAKAELILEKMERLYRSTGEKRFRPRTETYNAIIDAWAKSGDVSAPHRAELLLGYMTELYETRHNVHAKPNVRSYNSVINAWAKSGHVYAPERAMDVLDRMLQGELQVFPDTTSFATVIHAYARSVNYGKADSAYQLFLKMKELYDVTQDKRLRPNNIVYNSVLNACAFTVGDIEEQCRAIEIANDMFRSIVDDNGAKTRPDEVTYGTYLKVILNQMPEGKQRDKIVRAIFDKAAKDGMVGTLVLRQVKDAELDIEGCEKVFGSGSIDLMTLDGLSSSWTRNVVKGSLQRGQ